jgi:SAM-dependent methyltransferase
MAVLGARMSSLRKRARFQVRRGYLLTRRTLGAIVIERRLGIETRDYADLETLGVAGPGRKRYEPSKWLDLRRALPRREVRPEDVFLDVGSGKGRIVLQAAAYPFRRVIGVELSPELNAIAAANVKARRHALRCTEIELVTADVAEFTIPDDVTIVYHYNSIGGVAFAALVQRLLESLERRPRELRFIYNTALEEQALLATGRFRLVRMARGLRPGPGWSRKLAIRVYSSTISG